MIVGMGSIRVRVTDRVMGRVMDSVSVRIRVKDQGWV